MSTRNRTKSVSLRRNRDYTEHFVWTNELNNDLLLCYYKAKEDPRPGYMKRMKELWDVQHPNLNHFNPKQLRQQAVNALKQRETQEPVPNTGIGTRQQNETDEVLPQPPPPNPESIDDPTEEVVIDGDPPTPEITDNPTEEVVIDRDLVIKLTETFTQHFQTFEEKSLRERNYDIPVYDNITNDEWNAINYVIDTFLETRETVDLWTINVTHYAAAMAMLELHNKLPSPSTNTKKNSKKKTFNWMSSYQEHINKIRRKISYIEVILNCRKKNLELTSRQATIQKKLRKQYGSTRTETLDGKLTVLKHELKVACEYLRRRKTVTERNQINNRFKYNQKKVFRDWKSKAIKVEEPPTKEAITEFWSNIWHNKKEYNKNAKWLENLERSYCTNVTKSEYVINKEVFDGVLKKVKNRGAPGPDRTQAFWIKKFTSTHSYMITEYSKHLEDRSSLAEWLSVSRTILLPKNSQTKQAKNYRPIACQNILYKLYTGILYTFLQDHVTSNNIMELEQAGGRNGSWGCADQLIINKMIHDEVRKYRRNIMMMWFDYQKAFDSMPHDWIIKSLELANVPQKLIDAVKQLMNVWATKVTLHTESGEIETEEIKYLTGLLQGDSLSMLLFTLGINPLSFLLRKLPGYKIGGPDQRDTDINHLFFVDDLKTFANNQREGSLQLELITRFSNDITMKFGESKCAYLYIERGKRKTLGGSIVMNDLTLSELPEGDHYKYLGQDEAIGIDGALNKERVTSEYFKRIRKIWNSELYANNKTTAQNIFANPVLTPTFGILDWTKEELRAIDIKTRKLLSLSGSFHVNSDTDRLYSNHQVGGRGLNSIEDIYITRILAFAKHLKEIAGSNPYLRKVCEHEKDSLFRVERELTRSLELTTKEDDTPKTISVRTKQRLKDLHEEHWLQKKQHGYLFSKRKDVPDVNTGLTNAWHKNSNFSSHVHGFLCAIQEEEIETRHLRYKRAEEKNRTDPKCRLCHTTDETIHHIVACCPMLSASMYLPLRHDQVAKDVYRKLVNDNDDAKVPIRDVYSTDEQTIWWDQRVKTPCTLKHNKPDILLWNKTDKKCYIIDIVVGLDINVEKNCQLKHDNYFQLGAELKRIYSDYSFEVVPISLGATGLVTNSLTKNLKKIGISNPTKLAKRLQQKALVGTMKIVKSFTKSM